MAAGRDMKRRWAALAPVMVALVSGAACGATRVTANYVVNDTVAGGGGHLTSANYAMDGSLGGMGGIATQAAPSVTLRQGYIAQLAEPTLLTITAPASLNEGAGVQLGGFLTLDDNTLVPLGGSLAWADVSYPFASLSVSGLLTAATVYADTYGVVTGRVADISGTATVLVLNTVPDDYGSYSGDGIPDSWQVQYFGLSNASAGATVDLFGTGDNHFKYVCGLDPTNPASRFALDVITTQADWMVITFAPRWPDRSYTVQCSTNPSGGTFRDLAEYIIQDSNTVRRVTDVEASQPRKFYRIRISYP